MTPTNNDEGLAVLRQVFDQAKAPLPWSLVDTCYRIQLKHQFESDRDIAINEIKHAVSQVVSEMLAGDDERKTL